MTTVQTLRDGAADTLHTALDYTSGWGSIVAGAGLLAASAKRGSLGGLLLAAAGGVVFYHGLKGLRQAGGPSGWHSADQVRHMHQEPQGGSAAWGAEIGSAPEAGEHRWGMPAARQADVQRDTGDHVESAPESGGRVRVSGSMGDVVAEGSDASFPASDPPSWTPGRA